MIYDLIVVGGGAAGVFAAINAKSIEKEASVLLLEKSAHPLAKVRISGGGRCNVTHACFDPHRLIENYPRGSRELLAPFMKFGPRETIDWFQSKGVALKTEVDGRVFPVSDNSETIIECLLQEAKESGVEIGLRQKIEQLSKQGENFHLQLKDGGQLECRRLILATGSSADGYASAKQLGHTLQSPVPSLFTFNIPAWPLKELSGISVELAELQIQGSSLIQRGALLITHFGLSGPAALKLSAWGARHLHAKEYRVQLSVNWLPDHSLDAIFQKLSQFKKQFPQRQLGAETLFRLPKNLWKKLIEESDKKRMNDLSLQELRHLAQKLHGDLYSVEGKTTNKEEFVTCGGVELKEVNFKTMESKICPGLYFAGEILDIDGVTGGFNFQNAWTTGFISGSNCLRDC